MTNSEMLDLLMSRLGGRSSSELRAKLLIELNEWIKQVENGPIIPYFLENRWTDTTVADQDYLDLPSDFMREIEQGKFKIQNSEGKWVRLFKVSLEKLEDETENEDPAIPEGYALFGSRVYFGPVPDDEYNIKLPYYGRTTAVVDNGQQITNKWLLEYFNYTTLSALMVVARLHIQSAEMIIKIQPELQKAEDMFWRSVEAREHANADYLLGDSEN